MSRRLQAEVAGPRVIFVSIQELLSGAAGYKETVGLHFGIPYDVQESQTVVEGFFACCKVVDDRLFAGLSHYKMMNPSSN